MASRISSDRPRFLPPGVRPQPVRVLGTTWTDRGTAYWLRRAWIACVRLWMVLAMLIVVIPAWQGLDGTSWAMRRLTAVHIGILACTAAGFVFGGWQARKSLSATRTPAEWKEIRLAWRARHPLLTSRLLLGSLSIVFLPVTAPFFLGFLISYLAAVTCGRELPAERGARIDLERQLAETRT